MLLTFYITIGIIGLLFGSFSTVLITRWHNQETGILFGRSKCPKCHHTLSWFELFPLFSYIFLLGKCRKCASKIPLFYPLAELLMASIFLLLTISYIQNQGYFIQSQFFLLLLLGFITGVYILADIQYMEIPDQILVPGIFGYAILLGIGVYSETISTIFFDRFTYLGGYGDFLFDHITGAIILYTFLFLQILIPATIHLSKKGKWSEIFEVFLSYFTFPFLLLFPPKDTKNEEEEGIETWVGGGDLRIALFIGLTLGVSHGIFAFFVAYIFGSIIGIILIILRGKLKSQIPFGPFLAAGWIMAICFHNDILIIIEAYKSLF